MAAFNEKAAKDSIGRSQPPLTEDEVIAAIRDWMRQQIKVDDETYVIYKKIADTKMLPKRAKLDFTTRGKTFYGSDLKLWCVTLVVETGTNSSCTFIIRSSPAESTVQRRISTRL